MFLTTATGRTPNGTVRSGAIRRRAPRDAAGLTPGERRVIENQARLDAVRRVLALNGQVDGVLARLVALGARTLGTPMAAVSFVDRDRQVFKSAVGLQEPWRSSGQMPLRYSLCKHAVGSGRALVVSDARRHPVFRSNASVQELGVRAYVGVPLVTREGHVLGTFNAVDLEAREWTARDVEACRELAALVAIELEQQLTLAAADAAVTAAQSRLERSLRARDDFLAMTVHDLRNYLNVIALGLSPAEESEGMPLAQRQREVQRVQTSVEHMNRMIRDLLDVAKLEDCRLPMQPRAQRLDALIGEPAALLRPLAEKRSLVLDVEIEDGACEVLADRDGLTRVFANLIGNAIKFTPERGRVAVRAAIDGDVVRFAVADTGPGIDEEEIPHLFERFWQSSAHHVPGAGLGLAIAKAIVEAHGGRIWVETRRGAGTTFHFTVPAAPRRGAGAAGDVRERME